MATYLKENFGIMKTLLDVHTMGINASASLLRECGYNVFISTKIIEDSLDRINAESSQLRIVEWIKDNNISSLGFSYRLDPEIAVSIFTKLINLLVREGLYNTANAQVKKLFFSGLVTACNRIEEIYSGRVATFKGGESVEETLLAMGVPFDKIPRTIIDGCKYDKEIQSFGKQIISKGDYVKQRPLERNMYPEFGTFKDTINARLYYNFKSGFQPLVRAHSGPFSAELTRLQCLQKYNEWCQILGKSGYLDILSIGSSQLSQSNFGESWDNMVNGGGVPVNSEQEYFNIWKASRPMLVRTYSGTKNIQKMAEIYEHNINIAWHALSLWWFNELDGRGPNSLYKNLQEHINTIRYIATTNKPVEPNVPHHFAFRGCDDVTYIVSAYLAAKLTKKCGIKTYIQQNMLNTPRSTWGIQDIAKSRALLHMVKGLEDDNFKVILQTRAGLDYFKPNIHEAKEQLATVTALMDDIDPLNIYSPEIIHVVSYSEALFLADPEVINDSIKIVRTALSEYRKLKKNGLTPDVLSDEIINRTVRLENSARAVVKAMEENIPNLYSPEGFYLAFVAGWLPVPELWSTSDEFACAKNWETKMINGGIALIDKGLILNTDTMINRCIANLQNAKYMLKSKYKVTLF